MERESVKKKSSINVHKIDAVMSIAEACNEFHLTGVLRQHAMKKYAEKKYSVNEWTEIFHKDRIV